MMQVEIELQQAKKTIEYMKKASHALVERYESDAFSLKKEIEDLKNQNDFYYTKLKDTNYFKLKGTVGELRELLRKIDNVL